METLTITPAQAARDIADCIAADVPFMLWGSPGIGKSEIVRQTAAATARELFDLRLNVKDSPDLSGYLCLTECRPDQPPKMTAPADLPPTMHTAASLLFLDEINSASREVQAAAYQLVLERRINGYRLPKNCAIGAAGNLASDRGVVQAMPTPLKNRFVHFVIAPDVSQWQSWAMANGVNPTVIAWHSFKKNTLMIFDPKSDEPAFASPRSWVALSRILDRNPAPSMALITGTIGSGVGVEFSGFLQVMAELPPPDLVFMNPNAAQVPAEPSALYAISAALGQSVTVPTMPAFVAYLARLPSQEFSVLAMDIATRRNASLAHCPAFITWAQANAYILGLTN
jgi:hypothetical protein